MDFKLMIQSRRMYLNTFITSKISILNNRIGFMNSLTYSLGISSK
jgi:hypothetical protein